MAGIIVQNARRGENSPTIWVVSGAFKALGALMLAVILVACSPQTPPAAASGPGPGGPFHLVDQDGKPVDQSVLSGKWSVVFFGYTFCPDVCPTTLTNLGSAMKALGPKAAQTRVVFITIDPARDTPAALKTYLSSPVFPRNAIGLTGTQAQVAAAAKAYGVYFQKDGTGANYTMDHSTAIYVMNPQGSFQTVIADGLTPDQEAQQISRAMGAG
jgi:protein SCO1/2